MFKFSKFKCGCFEAVKLVKEVIKLLLSVPSSFCVKKIVKIAVMQLLVKCYYKKMVKSVGGSSKG